MNKPEGYLETNFEGHDEFFDWKGTRFDVYVKIDELYFILEFDVMMSIQASVKICQERGSYYTAETT